MACSIHVLFFLPKFAVNQVFLLVKKRRNISQWLLLMSCNSIREHGPEPIVIIEIFF